MDRSTSESRVGLLCGFAAYGLWGVMPLYFRTLKNVAPLDLLAYRIFLSALLLAAIISLLRRWNHVRACLADPKTRWLLAASTVLIAVNWFVFIYGVSINKVVQNSLGYFINPLLNILIGVVIFRERLRGIQWLALILAGVGLVYLIVSSGEPPWIALALAGSFAAYGLIRKVAPVNALLGLTVETLLLAPVSAVALALWATNGQTALGKFGLLVDVLLLLSGVVTTVPLLFFGQAARLLRMSTLGFLQYLAPSMQFLTAVLLFREPFLPAQQVSFALIWSALALVSLDAILRRQRRTAEATLPATAPALPAEMGLESRS